MAPEDSEQTRYVRSRIGRKAQVGGAIVLLMGLLLLLFGPSATPGIPLDPHRLAYIFIGLGIFLILVGTVARMLLLD